MYKGYNKIFWGIFIMTFNIKFGHVKILPAFIGLFVISSGLNILHGETKLESFDKAQSIAIFTGILSLLGGVVDFILEGSLGNSIPMLIWTVIYSATELILFFKIMEASIEYLKSNNFPELEDEYIRKLRIYILTSIVNIVFTNFGLMFNISLLLTIVLVIGFILRIYLMVIFNRLKKLFNVDIISGEE